MSDFDDLGDVGDFEEPPTSVERFLDNNPGYGEQVAKSLRAGCLAKGAEVGILIQKRLNKLGRELSDHYGDQIMGAAIQALRASLPANIDKSDIEILDEDDCDMDVTFETMRAFWDGMKPYVIAAVSELAQGLDWGFPFSVAEMVQEEYPNLPLPPA